MELLSYRYRYSYRYMYRYRHQHRLCRQAAGGCPTKNQRRLYTRKCLYIYDCSRLQGKMSRPTASLLQPVVLMCTSGWYPLVRKSSRVLGSSCRTRLSGRK